jgi:4-diphosphocytidyl-2-C-methyl-D-erythritol kinase
MRIERAPAKINLTLRVLGRRADGFHELESLVAFAGVCDLLKLDPGKELGLVVEGPTANAAGADSGNLVLRAARALQQRVSGLKVGEFSLKKRLPVAAGLGGGSSDAAAALRLLAELNGLKPNDPRIHEAAAETGSDVPVCLTPTARMFRGRGEHVGPRIALPPLAAVLVNPGVHVSTADVFRALGLQPGSLGPSQGTGVQKFEGDIRTLAGTFARDANDLEPPAQALSPIIADTLETLRAAPEVRFVRMSGSGATVFGLFDNCRHAARAAKAVRAAHPDWWVKATVLR